MKKTLLLIPAIALLSCGGNSNSTDSVHTDSTNTDTTLAQSEPVDQTLPLPDAVGKFINSLPKSPDKPFYLFLNNGSNDEGVFDDDHYYIYPIKSGGHAIIRQHCEFPEEGEPQLSYIPYIYKDGEAKPASHIMPIPDISLFFNNDKLKGHESDIKLITETYNKNPRNYVYYAVSENEPIIHSGVDFEKFSFDDQLYPILAYNFFLPAYKWDGEKFAYYDMLAEFVKTLPKKAGKPVYSFTDEYDIRQKYCGNTIVYYALPHKNGGYMALVCYQAQCEATLFWDNFTYVSKDGKITKVENILPVPDVNDLLDADKCKGHDAQVNDIKKQYNSAPKNYLLYSITESGELNATMEGNGCEQWGESDLDLMKNAVYTWDGEKFVLKSSGNIAMQFWKEFLKEYDPLGMVEGDEMPSAEMIASNLEMVKEAGSNIATFVAEGAEGFEETAICFKRNDGSYLVMDYFNPKSDSPHRILLYNFRNGKISFDETTDLFLPEYVVSQQDPGRFNLSKGYYIKRFTDKGFYVVGQGGDGYNFEWNGEEFFDPSME